MTIAITTSGISLDGPLVAGEKVAVSVSGLSLAAEDKPTLALLARFPDALLASAELAEDADAPGTWTGELDTATKQTALFFATARADERRDAALELVAGRVSLARLTVPMANSALCPKPDGSPFASPVYVPVPGPPGQVGDPYDQQPEMDGEASAGTADEYARGDHRHPTDATRQAVIADLAAIRSGAAAGATAVQPAALSAYRTATAQDAIDGALEAAIAAKYTKPADGIPATDLASGVIPSVPSASDTTPQMDGAGAAGTATTYARGDHQHPSDTSRMPASYTGENISLFPIGPTIAFAVNSMNDTLRNSVASLAPAFSTSSTYAVGDYATYEGLLYKCTTAVSTAGAWNAANWSAVSAMGESGDVNVIETVKVNGTALTPDANKAVNIVKKVWAASATYSSATGWTVTPEGTDFSLADGDVVFFIASNSATNNVKANVGGSGAINIVKAADSNHPNVTQGDWSSGDIVVLQYSGKKSLWVLLGAKKAPLASPAFTGTPTAPTAPAGTNTTQIATTAFVQTAVAGKADASALRYSLPAAISVSDATSTAALADRAVNTVTVGAAVTTLNLSFPAAVAGYARDFFLRLDCAGTALATIALPSGETVDFGADALAGLTGKAGVHLALFTEIAANHWLVSVREAEA